ncbi:hypothetical protein HOK51_03245 [Candidatus Woesearchaeota archaeon]|jgi:hypothetical protein|nr:hypothetical protein [Candidatus Woesearchaeota archaeon]MBT6518835.1 hypothetical protein [Candidatus Woesearchaeota archaeon]MBT7367974.1 hypothetical protein [Candidatus Woesearchaeota archaeon]
MNQNQLQVEEKDPIVRYNQISKEYCKIFGLTWTLDEIVKKSKELIDTITEVSKEYEKKINVFEPQLFYKHQGMNVEYDNLENALKFMTTKKEQKKGVLKFIQKFNINEQVECTILYSQTGHFDSKRNRQEDSAAISIRVIPNHLTPKDRAFYHNLFGKIHN